MFQLWIILFVTFLQETAAQRYDNVTSGSNKDELEAEKLEIRDLKRNLSEYVNNKTDFIKLVQAATLEEVAVSFNGEPIAFYILLFCLIPLVISELFRMLWNLCKPTLKYKPEGGGEFPFIPVYYLQETTREQLLKREERNCIPWFVHQYILAGDEDTLDWKDIIKSLHPPEKPKTRKPWAMFRLLTKMGCLNYSRTNTNYLSRVPFKHSTSMASKIWPKNKDSYVSTDLISKISKLSAAYSKLNNLDVGGEPRKLQPQMFTIRQLMEFMTPKEKLLVLRYYDHSRLDSTLVESETLKTSARTTNWAEFENSEMSLTGSLLREIDNNNRSTSSIVKRLSQTGDHKSHESVHEIFNFASEKIETEEQNEDFNEMVGFTSTSSEDKLKSLFETENDKISNKWNGTNTSPTKFPSLVRIHNEQIQNVNSLEDVGDFERSKITPIFKDDTEKIDWLVEEAEKTVRSLEMEKGDDVTNRFQEKKNPKNKKIKSRNIKRSRSYIAAKDATDKELYKRRLKKFTFEINEANDINYPAVQHSRRRRSNNAKERIAKDMETNLKESKARRRMVINSIKAYAKFFNAKNQTSIPNEEENTQ